MSGNSLFIDTNIVLYLLNGDKTIADLLHGKSVFISFVTELELLGYKEITLEETKRIEDFLADVTIVDINSEIKRLIIELRKVHKLKLPDSIVAASSLYLNLPLLTADKEISKLSNLDILLYEK